MSTVDTPERGRGPARSLHSSGLTRRAARPLLLATGLIVGLVGFTACDPQIPCTATWVGPAGGDYADAGSWSTGAVPDADSVACAPVGSSIVLSDSRAVTQASLKGDVTIAATGSLTASYGMSSFGSLEQHGTLAGPGSFTVNHLDWQGGSLLGGGVLAVTGGASSTISGDIQIAGSKRLLLLSDVTWTAGTIRLCDDALLTVGANGAFVADNLDGRITSEGCTTVATAATETRDGGLFLAESDLVVTTPYTNAATTRIDCGATMDVASYVQPAAATTAVTDVVCASVLQVADGDGELQLDGGLLAGGGIVAADVVGAGTINPGNPDVIDSVDSMLIIGSYTATPGATLPFEIAGEDLDDQDILYLTGTADVTEATFAPRIVGAFAPVAGQEFQPLNADVVVGPFATFTPPTGTGLTWTLGYSPIDITLTASA